MDVSVAYDEIIEFIATGATPAMVVAFKPSPQARRRVAELIQREKTAELSGAEKAELDQYMQLEHLMRLAKARARRYVNGES